MQPSAPSCRPRVLHLITRLDPGGSATNTLATAAGLRKRGFEPALWYGRTVDPEHRIVRRLEAAGIAWKMLPHLVRAPHPWHDCAAWLHLRAALVPGLFDLVHTHSSKAGVLGRLAAARCAVPCVHTPHGHVFYGYFNPLLSRVFIQVERRMARRTARIISLTDLETEQSLAAGIGRAEQYVTIPSGVPLRHFRDLPVEGGAAVRAEHRIPDEAFVFVAVGRLTPVKGFDVLLDAFAKLRHDRAHLLIVGEGECRAELEAQTAQSACGKRVHFSGERRDVRPALAAANAFVLASRNEGMGRAFIEAMAAGLPAIGTTVGGVPSVIVPGHSGLLAAPDDAGALAQAMDQLAGDRAACRRMGVQAARDIDPRYDQETMIDQIAALYRDVLHDRVSA